MTVRTLYDNLLIELNKVEAPSLLLEDFIYFANKAVQQYTNKRYNQYDITQQTTDDLRVLKQSCSLNITSTEKEVNIAPSEDARWQCELPNDYLHLLNCIVVFDKNSSYEYSRKCDTESNKSKVKSMARRLTSDMYPSIMQNAYFKPSYKCPYYFITNYNETYKDGSTNAKLEDTLNPSDENNDSTTKHVMEIRCGSTSKYYPKTVFIDYLRVPSTLALTYADLESEFDRSQALEFPEYVCYEIQNELVKLVLENIEDPRLQTNIPINQSIAEIGINNNK